MARRTERQVTSERFTPHSPRVNRRHCRCCMRKSKSGTQFECRFSVHFSWCGRLGHSIATTAMGLFPCAARTTGSGRSETPGCRPQRPQPVCCGRSTGSSRRPLVAIQRSRGRPLLRRAKGCNGGRTRPLNGKRCNFIGHCLSGPVPIRTNNPQNCGTRAVLRNETRARKSPKPACRLAPRPGLEPGTCGLTVRRSTD